MYFSLIYGIVTVDVYIRLFVSQSNYTETYVTVVANTALVPDVLTDAPTIRIC